MVGRKITLEKFLAAITYNFLELFRGTDRIRESMSFEELSKYYNLLYRAEIKNHDVNSSGKFREDIDWSRMLKLISQEHDIRKFDSGFCSGVVLLKDGQTVAQVTTAHYSRRP